MSPARRTARASAPAAKAPRALAFEGLDIELRPFKEPGFRPSCVVVGISSEGTVGPLVASHLIQQLEMDQVCGLESPSFPPTSMVYFRKPKFPARIYGSKRHRLAVVLAEFAPMDELARPLAHAILAWCGRHGARQVIALERFAAEDSSPAGVGLAAVGSTPQDRRAIAKARLSEIQHGMVSGVAGVLLNEGRWLGRPTIALLSSMGASIPDPEAAARALAAVGRLLPGLRLRAQSADREPTQLEKAIRSAHQRHASHDFI